jgi:NAD(P)-dependent dehydrogenase (short-subunit alcohol dehydrogenase family)
MATSAVAVVTGAASGIGAATARRLARDGLHVVCCDVVDDAGQEVAAEIGGSYARLDVSDPAAWAELADRLSTGEGRLAAAHLNAGVLTAPVPTEFLDVPLARLERVRGVNLDGVLLGVRALAPLMTAGGGAIVATASLAGLGPYEDDPMYAATKHAVVGFVRSVAPQLAARGVRLHAVCPGGVNTGLLAPEHQARIAASGRPMLDPAEVADAVAALLAADEAGLVYTIVAGRGAQPYEFRGVPGPRAPRPSAADS